MRIRWDLAAAAILLAVLHVAAVRIATASTAQRGRADNDILGAVLGDARVVVARGLYEKADTAFHMGAPHLDCCDAHAGHEAGHEPEGADEDREHRGRHGEHGEEPHAVVPRWIAWIDSEVHPRSHRHLEGQEIREMLPWLAMAIHADPTAAEPYVVAAYWLGWVLQRPDAAETVLRNGLARATPTDRIARELGRLLLTLRGRPHDALPHLRAALELWDRAAEEGSEPDPEDRAQTLFYLVECLAAVGDEGGARAAARELLELWPGKPGLRDHLAALGGI